MFSLARLPQTFALLVVTLSLIGCGGQPPDKEIQQAEAAIAAAETAQAGAYARTELNAAKDALANAREAVGGRDYRLALNHALDSRERAQNAAVQASAALAAARSSADSAISTAVTTLNEATSKIKAADASHVSPRTLAGPRAGIADAETRLQEARTAWEKGDFAAATAAAAAASEHLSAMAEDFDALVPSARRRR